MQSFYLLSLKRRDSKLEIDDLRTKRERNPSSTNNFLLEPDVMEVVVRTVNHHKLSLSTRSSI